VKHWAWRALTEATIAAVVAYTLALWLQRC
jgi:hypothetical protein